MANQNKTDIGLIGLAVMGENLALNMESKGWHVSVYNRTVPGVEEGVVAELGSPTDESINPSFAVSVVRLAKRSSSKPSNIPISCLWKVWL